MRQGLRSLTFDDIFVDLSDLSQRSSWPPFRPATSPATWCFTSLRSIKGAVAGDHDEEHNAQGLRNWKVSTTSKQYPEMVPIHLSIHSIYFALWSTWAMGPPVGCTIMANLFQRLRREVVSSATDLELVRENR